MNFVATLAGGVGGVEVDSAFVEGLRSFLLVLFMVATVGLGFLMLTSYSFVLLFGGEDIGFRVSRVVRIICAFVFQGCCSSCSICRTKTPHDTDDGDDGDDRTADVSSAMADAVEAQNTENTTTDDRFTFTKPSGLRRLIRDIKEAGARPEPRPQAPWFDAYDKAVSRRFFASSSMRRTKTDSTDDDASKIEVEVEEVIHFFRYIMIRITKYFT